MQWVLNIEKCYIYFLKSIEYDCFTQSFQEKCNSLVSTEPAEDAVEVVAQELTSKIDAARETEKLVMKRMAAFVSKHFPLPDQSQVSFIWKKKNWNLHFVCS